MPQTKELELSYRISQLVPVAEQSTSDDDLYQIKVRCGRSGAKGASETKWMNITAKELDAIMRPLMTADDYTILGEV